MRRLSDTTVSAVKGIQDIVGIIQDYVKLKRRGRHYVGLCPFHSERTPSFTVSPEKHLWHCFGCQESGDHIGFIMKVDHLSFTEAIEHIAVKSGIAVEWDERSPDSQHADQELAQLRTILSTARDFYRSFLDAGPALPYLAGRRIATDIARQFGVGYSPASSDLITHLRNHGFEDAVIQTAGITVAAHGKLQDRFQGRLIFPIHDDRGRTIGFGGRVLGADHNGPKYLNSDETRVFAKRRVLYGLDVAKTSIRKMGMAVIMEGYTDVIVAHQYGFTHSVAALGTAFSSDHARLLHRLAPLVVTALDQDDAGIKATERVYEQCNPLGIAIRVATFDGKDPADVLTTHGREYFEDCLTNSISFTEYKFKLLCKQYPPHRIEDVAKIVDEIIPYLRKEPDTVIQRHYAKRIATILKIDPDLVLAKLSNLGYTSPPKRLYTVSMNKKTKYQLAEESLLFAMATNIQERVIILDSLELTDFQDHEFREVATLLCEFHSTDRELIDALTSDNARKILSRILVERANDAQISIQECIRTLKRYPMEQRIQEIKGQLKNLDNEALDTSTDSLLNELHTLITALEEG